MGKTSETRSADQFRRKVRELLNAGYGVAQISKATGKSYIHTKRIVSQEVAAFDKAMTRQPEGDK